MKELLKKKNITEDERRALLGAIKELEYIANN